MNTERSPFNHASIRKAFSAALDRQFITSYLLVGDIPLRTPLPEKLSFTHETVIDANQIEAKRLFEKGLQETGYTRDTFPKVTLGHFINVSGFTELAEYMQKVWSETFLIPVQLDGREWNPFFEVLQNGAFQIGGCSFDSHCHDPMEFFSRFENKNPFNFSKWTSTRFQENMVRIQRASFFAERKKLFIEAENILMSEMPIIPICTHVHYYIHQKKWTGLKIDPSGCVDFSEVRATNY